MGELSLDINGLSKHINSDISVRGGEREFSSKNPYNEVNQGLGLSYTWAKNKIRKSIIGGTYKNSINKQSNYLGGEFTRRLGDEKLFADLGIRMGLVTGYGDVKPMLVPIVGVGRKNVSFNLGYIPKIKDVTPETFTLNARYRLGGKK